MYKRINSTAPQGRAFVDFQEASVDFIHVIQ